MPTLLDKVWDLHTVRRLPTGQTQIFIGLHLIHEVTTPQAFAMLRERGLRPAFPERIFGTMDHIIPTASLRRPTADPVAEAMIATLEDNCREHHIPLYGLGDAHQGIVHVIGPELGLTQPGMTIACGDSHTSTHGAFGALAFGIGTSQVRDVLGSQCLAMDKPKLRRVRFEGRMGPGRDREGFGAGDDPAAGRERRCRLRLRVHRRRRRRHDDGRAHDALQPVDRRRRADGLCQPGRHDVRVPARAVRTRPPATPGSGPSRGGAAWRATPDASADDERVIDVSRIAPVVTWGTNPGQSVAVDEPIPDPAGLPPGERDAALEALQFMGFEAGESVQGRRVDVAFIGSCTNAPLVRSAGRRRRGARAARGAPRPRAGRARLPRSAAGRRTRRAATRCSSRPVSNGASPDARSAWA